MAKVTLKGNPFETAGELPPLGEPAPDFRLVNGELKDVTLADFKGKKKILNVVPSLDTAACATATRKFNEQAAGLDNTVVLTISADLPFAQGRFCSTEGLEHVIPLSLMRGRKFGKDYGVLATSGPLEGVLVRAVVVIDDQDRVVYTQLVPEIAEEPDYEAALAAAR